MNPFEGWKVGPVVCTVFGLALLTACSSSATPPAADATSAVPTVTAPAVATRPAELTQRFASPTQHFSVAIAPTWSVRPAVKQWTDMGREDKQSQNDVLTAPDHSSWAVTSMDLRPGESALSWMKRFAQPTKTSSSPAGCVPPLSGYKHMVVDGHPAWVHGAIDVCNFTEALIPVGNRVYKFTAYPSMATVDDHVYPPQMFRAVLASVKFK